MICHSSGNIFPTVANSLLIDLIQNNQEEAYSYFTELIDYYSRKLGYEDAVGEFNLLFYKLINRADLNRFNADDTDYLCRYIKTSLKHKYIALSKQRQIEENSSCELNENITGITMNFETKLELKELLNLLTKKQKKVLYYRYIEGYSDSEIADMLGITRQSVCQIKNRALKFLKEIMK